MGIGPMTGGRKGYCVVPVTGNYSSYQTVGVTNYMPASYAYSYGGSQMRRSYPFEMFRRERGLGICAQKVVVVAHIEIGSYIDEQ